jgi:hypothetical protein
VDEYHEDETNSKMTKKSDIGKSNTGKGTKENSKHENDGEQRTMGVR